MPSSARWSSAPGSTRPSPAEVRSRDGERAELVMKEHVFEARDVLVAHVRDLESSE